MAGENGGKIIGQEQVMDAPVFPIQIPTSLGTKLHPGISVRTLYAGMCMSGMVSRMNQQMTDAAMVELAKLSWQMADKMIAGAEVSVEDPKAGN